MRSDRLPERRRRQRRPPPPRRAFGSDHDQQRPHPCQHGYRHADERRPRVPARLIFLLEGMGLDMNVAMFAAPPEPASPPADPLDHLADVLFHEMGSPGVYGRTALYEDIVERLAALITRHREPDTDAMPFPPVRTRAHLAPSGYLKSFPNLLRCVCGLHGTEKQ